MFWPQTITLWFPDFSIRSNLTMGLPEGQDCVPQTQNYLPLSKTSSLCSLSWQQMLSIHFHGNILFFCHVPLEEIPSKPIPKGSRPASTILAMAQCSKRPPGFISSAQKKYYARNYQKLTGKRPAQGWRPAQNTQKLRGCQWKRISNCVFWLSDVQWDSMILEVLPNLDYLMILQFHEQSTEGSAWVQSALYAASQFSPDKLFVVCWFQRNCLTDCAADVIVYGIFFSQQFCFWGRKMKWQTTFIVGCYQSCSWKKKVLRSYELDNRTAYIFNAVLFRFMG